MKTLTRYLPLWRSSLSGLALGTAALCSSTTMAAGLMTPAASGLPQLDIKEHHVNVVIEDGYAVTTIDQTFFNPNSQDLEAVYSFPVPHKAAVGEFTYWIDGIPITGEVVEKEKAREIYAHEKSQGREVALTEQDNYRSFDTKVYPVRAQSDVKIRLTYIQTVHVDMGMGRYVYPLEEGGVDEQKLAFWSYNDTVKQAFSFNMTMRSSYPIEDFRLPQHPQATIHKSSPQDWQVGFSNGAISNEEGASSAPMQQPATHSLDKDIVVYWRHQPDLPGTVDMVTYKEPDSNKGTFMMTLTPGDDLPEIQSGRDWMFVLDISGSMQGKYASLIDGVSKGLQKLHKNDRFRIVIFNNNARELTPGYVPVNPENITQYTKALSNVSANGGTNLYAGLEKGFKGLDADRPSAVLLVTDGVANVGKTEKKQFLKLLEKTDVRLFSFVMGNSANRPLLEGMTKVSNGFAMAVSNSDDIVGRIIQTTDKLTHEAYRDIDIDIRGKGIKIDHLTPILGSLYRGQQLIVFGHYRGDGNALLDIDVKISDQEKTYSSPLYFPASNTLNPEIERLWAFATIETLQNRIDYLGQDGESQQAIIDLSKEYGLVTDYTSMVVMREEQFKQHNIQRTNQQRVQKEESAKSERELHPIRDHRQDTAQPAFNDSRPNLGSGALGPWFLIFLIPLLGLNRKTVTARNNFK